MSNLTHETVPTHFVEAEGIRYAYRRFGKTGTIPLLFLQYFNANMDGWDPAVTNGLAADHEVILFDNVGVGASGGETPYTVVEMTQHCVAFCRALGLNSIHIVGFSLGGMIAQQLAGRTAVWQTSAFCSLFLELSIFPVLSVLLSNPQIIRPILW